MSSQKPSLAVMLQIAYKRHGRAIICLDDPVQTGYFIREISVEFKPDEIKRLASIVEFAALIKPYCDIMAVKEQDAVMVECTPKWKVRVTIGNFCQNKLEAMMCAIARQDFAYYDVVLANWVDVPFHRGIDH